MNPKQSRFINDNLTNVVSPANARLMRRASQPQTVRNVGKPKTNKDMLGKQLNDLKTVLPKSLIKREAGEDFIMNNNKSAVKATRFPKLAEELKKQERARLDL